MFEQHAGVEAVRLRVERGRTNAVVGGDPDDVDVGDTQRWDDVGRYANPSGWVYRVGLNWARSRRRKWAREVFRSESPDSEASPAPEVDPALDEALAALPVEQRSVVVLRYLLDWSEFQTAEALEIAPGTVKSRLSRALERLAVALENPHDT